MRRRAICPLHHDVGVGAGQPPWLPERPPQRDAELAEWPEPQPGQDL